MARASSLVTFYSGASGHFYFKNALSDILVRKLSAGDFHIPVSPITRTCKSAVELVPDMMSETAQHFI